MAANMLNPDRPIVLPVTIVNRLGNGKKCAESYIMMSSKRNKYVLTQSSRASSKYMANILVVKGEIEKGNLKTSYHSKNVSK